MPAADLPFTLTALGHGLAASPGSVPFALEPAVESGESSGLVGVGGVRKTLAPALNKFHVGNGDDGKHYWLVPPEVWDPLNAEFRFDFDPCPWPKPDDFDGLTCEWGQRNWVNPPFGSIMHQGKKKGPTAWMRKAIAEQAKGKLSVVVYPIDKWVLMMLKATCAPNVRNLGDVRWLATEDRSQGKGTGRHIAAFVLLPGGGGAELVGDANRGTNEGKAPNDGTELLALRETMNRTPDIQITGAAGASESERQLGAVNGYVPLLSNHPTRRIGSRSGRGVGGASKPTKQT